jgi:hypothetical protein
MAVVTEIGRHTLVASLIWETQFPRKGDIMAERLGAACIDEGEEEAGISLITRDTL